MKIPLRQRNRLKPVVYSRWCCPILILLMDQDLSRQQYIFRLKLQRSIKLKHRLLTQNWFWFSSPNPGNQNSQVSHFRVRNPLCCLAPASWAESLRPVHRNHRNTGSGRPAVTAVNPGWRRAFKWRSPTLTPHVSVFRITETSYSETSSVQFAQGKKRWQHSVT